MNIIFGLYIAFGGSILLLLASLIFFIRLLKSKKAKKVSEDLKKDVYLDSMKVLEDTRKESEEIIGDALKKAESTISQAEFITHEAQREFSNEMHEAEQKAEFEFKKTSEVNEREFQVLFDQIRKEFENQARQTMTMLQGVVQKEADVFRQALQSQTIDAEKQVQSKIQNEFQAVSLEIESYKKSQIEQVNQAVNVVVRDITSEVIGKSLTSQDHSQIILASFEKAFRDGVLQQPMSQNISN